MSPAWDLVDEMEPEDGMLWIYGTGDEQTIAFTDAGLESLQELLREHKLRHSGNHPRGPERRVTLRRLAVIPQGQT
jgi:hypothetical protein